MVIGLLILCYFLAKIQATQKSTSVDDVMQHVMQKLKS